MSLKEKYMVTETNRGKLGTFTGVFTPSILTILGIILFLRIAYVVGEAGILAALVIIVAANAISLLTSFSVSGIATNLRVKGGGDYYLISRTLGPEFGGRYRPCSIPRAAYIHWDLLYRLCGGPRRPCWNAKPDTDSAHRRNGGKPSFYPSVAGHRLGNPVPVHRDGVNCRRASVRRPRCKWPVEYRNFQRQFAGT